MILKSQFIEYAQTGYFSAITNDYIAAGKKLAAFYEHPFSVEGITAAIKARKKYPTDRKLLHTVLKNQYKNINATEKVTSNIEKLLLENTFTITTAHQPNIFTGPLYFIYKILHAIKLSDYLNTSIPNTHFVPVYFMGSEDADLDELGHIYINGEKYEWKTNQTGAVGRMRVDTALIELIETISGQLTVHANGEEIVALIKESYKEGVTIEQATFAFVNALFGEYGLIVLLPDNAILKKAFIPVIQKELKEQFSHKAVAETVAQFPQEYKIQASGREVNLFYLKDDKRERIEKVDGQWSMVNGSSTMDDAQILGELQSHPECFSPNVILRPVFQEMILPNVAFIGGGGELAYWLELKKVFEAVNVPYPVLVLRNSFLIVNADMNDLSGKLPFSIGDLFRPETELVKELVQKKSSAQLSLDKEKIAVTDFYEHLKNTAIHVDITLQNHIEALKVVALRKIEMLEKKMLRAEKKKFDTEQRQLDKLKAKLFPSGNLQERVENVLLFYAKYGNEFIKAVYENSKGLEQQFGILVEE